MKYLIPGSFLNYAEEGLKMARLEALYLADGRDNPEHPMHCLYTGLAAGGGDVPT